MRTVVPLLCAVLAIGAGAAAFAFLAEQGFGAEADALQARIGFKSGGGGVSKLLGLVDSVDPGASDRLKAAAAVTAVGGAAAGVLAYVALREVLG